MSSRPQFNPYPAILDGDMSDDITSDVTVIQKLSMISYSLSWEGSTPIGSVSVEVSNDYSQNGDGSVRNAGTWNAVPLSSSGGISTSISITGNSGNGFIDIDVHAGYAMRLVYTRSSGTGTLQAIINAKVS